MSYQSVLQSLPKGKGEDNLARIAYKSEIISQSTSHAEEVLEDVLRQSIKNNPSHQISGMLYFNVASFDLVQVLEGPGENVTHLYKVISEDPRHKNVTLILNERAKDRWYQEWGMLRGTPENWEELRTQLPSTIEWSRAASFDLGEVEKLPIAGDLDLQLTRVAYCSKLIVEPGAKPDNIVSSIVRHAHEKNQGLLIGGIMYFNRDTGEVFQCLEGPENAVSTLLSKISADPRHSDVVLINQEAATERSFKNFGMFWADDSQNAILLKNLPESVAVELQKRMNS